jgi:hypothetical protein
MQIRKNMPGIIMFNILETGLPLKIAGEQKKPRKISMKIT